MANNSVLVIGGGFSGMTAALEAAEVGHQVYLVEQRPFLGGRVAQLNKYFPKLCPPSCGLEIQFQRIKKNPNLKVFTLAEVVSVSGSKGDFKATVKIKPRHTARHAADLSQAAKGLSKEVPSDFEFGMKDRKALYVDAPFSFPHRYMLDAEDLTAADREKLADNENIDLDEQEKEIELEVGAIVLATGWKPYDVSKLETLGQGKVENVISNMQLERLASPHGPTGGKILRPSDKKPPKKICFVQCAGSRDENHLSYCSYICCTASLKQASYVREQLPESKCVIYYIDLRTPGRYQSFREKILADPGVTAVKGKVAEVEELDNGNVLITVEDAVAGIKQQVEYDLVVLATGMQPSIQGESLPFDVKLDEEGFIIDGEENGIFVAGCAKRPLDVMKSAESATGAAMKAIETVRGRD